MLVEWQRSKVVTMIFNLLDVLVQERDVTNRCNDLGVPIYHELFVKQLLGFKSVDELLKCAPLNRAFSVTDLFTANDIAYMYVRKELVGIITLHQFDLLIQIIPVSELARCMLSRDTAPLSADYLEYSTRVQQILDMIEIKADIVSLLE